MNAVDDFRHNNFDLLRIFAASQVMIWHSMLHLEVDKPVWWPLLEMFPGVPIFFVISGFLISAAYERSSSLQSYARSRALRIFPALWCCIVATVIVFSALGADFLRWQTLAWFPAQLVGLVYTPGFLKDFGFGSYNGSLWTIPIELQFYFLLPPLYWLARRVPLGRQGWFWAALALFVGIAVAIRMFAPDMGLDEGRGEPLAMKLLRYSFVPHFYLFLAGVVMQRLQAHRSPWIRGRGMWWLAAYLVVRFALPWSYFTQFAAMLMLGVCTISMAYTLPHLAEKLLHGTDVSYGVYIYHGLVVNVFVELGLMHSGPAVALLAVVVYVVAWASWVGLEKPCLRLKKRSPRPPTVAAAAPVLPADRTAGQ